MSFFGNRAFAVATLSLVAASPSWADFVVDKSPEGKQLIVNGEKSDGFSFSGKVGEKASGPTITVKSDEKLNFGSSNDDEKENESKPKDTVATDIIFSVDSKDTTGLSEFSFRGQLDSKAGGVLDLIVTDNNNKSFDFKFTGLGKNEDFKRIGVIANTKGEYIKSIELKSLFKSVKENEFSNRYLQVKGSEAGSNGSDGKENSDGESSYGENSGDGTGAGSGGGVISNAATVPEPSTLALLSIAGIALAVGAIRTRRTNAEVG